MITAEYSRPMPSAPQPIAENPVVVAAQIGLPGRGAIGGEAKARLWPAVLVTFLTGMGFASLKLLLITEIALEFDPAAHQPFSLEWMERMLQYCIAKGNLSEAVSQGLAAVLTLGVLVGFAVNSPLAGAWRVAPMFALSSLGVALCVLLTLGFNPWPLCFITGIAYGTACAARGKAIPLLSIATGVSNTRVSGMVNAALVVGLLSGTIFGMALGQIFVHKDPHPWARAWMAHAILAAFLLFAAWLGARVRVPEPPVTPFLHGVRDLARGTVEMLRDYWALIVPGGLIWGIASAASLAVLIYGVEDLQLDRTAAATIGVFAAIGAILGNLASHWLDRRRYAIASILGLGASMAAFPYLVHGYLSAAISMVLVGALFAAPANVLDSRLLLLSGRRGLSGRGATVMSMTHNVFILLIGAGLAIPFFLGHIDSKTQFWLLGAVALVTAGLTALARLNDRPVGEVR